MTPNLQNELGRFVSPNVINKLNKFYYENNHTLEKAIDVSLRAFLMGCYLNADERFIQQKINEIENYTFYKELNFPSGTILAVDPCYKTQGNAILDKIFNVKKARVAEMISNETGVKSETAHEVLNFSALLTISYLHHQSGISENLKTILDEQKREISKGLPPGVKIILGLSTNELIEEKKRPYIEKSLFNHLFAQKKLVS